MEVPNVIVRRPLLVNTRVAVADECDRVKLTIGNSTMEMAYEDALKLSQMIRVHAKKAKRFAGDNSRHWSVIGVLEDYKR